MLRSTSFGGCTVVVSRTGETLFYDADGSLLASVAGVEGSFSEVRLQWKSEELTIQFGHMEEVDNYPNCDGEHDRWSSRWVADRTVTL